MVLSVADVKKLTVPRLKEELTKRGLDSTGNKPDLLTRLIESIDKAVEDSILDGASNADLGIPSDDILNEDILDATSINGDDADKLLNASSEITSPTETTVPEAGKTNTSPDDAKRARAARFGLPITGTVSAEVLGSNTAKEARSKRFGATTDSPSIGSDEAKARRAARFGIETANNNEKLAARAARFGLPLGSSESSDGQSKKLMERAKRFSMIDEDMEAKKKARLERFGGAN